MLVSVVDYAAEGGGTDVGQTRIARSRDCGRNILLCGGNTA